MFIKRKARKSEHDVFVCIKVGRVRHMVSRETTVAQANQLSVLMRELGYAAIKSDGRLSIQQEDLC